MKVTVPTEDVEQGFGGGANRLECADLRLSSHRHLGGETSMQGC